MTEEFSNANEMGNNFSNYKESILSPLLGIEGDKKKEEISSESNNDLRTKSIDIECTTNDDDKQSETKQEQEQEQEQEREQEQEQKSKQEQEQKQESTKSPKLQYDRYRRRIENEEQSNIVIGDNIQQQFESQFRKFVRQQEQLWKQRHRKKSKEELRDEDYYFIIEHFIIPENKSNFKKRKNKKRKNKKRHIYFY